MRHLHSFRSLCAGSLLAIAAAAAAPALAEEGKKIVFATGGDFAPYDMTKPDGTLYGFEIDLIEQVAERAGFEYEFRQLAWDGMMESLIAGKFDAIIYGVTINEERAQVVDFSLPYTSSYSAFVAAKDGVAIEGMEAAVDLSDAAVFDAATEQLATALAGKAVGVEAGSTQAKLLAVLAEKADVTVREYVGVPQTYQDLDAGRIDLVLVGETSAQDYVTQNPDAAVITGPQLSGAMLGSGFGIAVQKGNSELLEQINSGLIAMSADGSLSALAVQWFERDITPKY